MSFAVGDVVQTGQYDDGVLFRLVCFLDRKGEQCAAHQGVKTNPALPDDVHLEVIWKSSEDIAPAWEKGDTVVVGSHRIEPPNGMMVSALAARGDRA